MDKNRVVITSLGLSITRSIISDHRGTLTIQSELHKGTQCILTFPLSSDHTVQREAALTVLPLQTRDDS